MWSANEPKAGSPRVQSRGETSLGAHEFDVPVDPPGQRVGRSKRVPQLLGEVRAGVDLLLEDSYHQGGPLRKVAVERAHPDPRPRR